MLVEKKNSLLTDTIDLDYLEILYREKFMVGKSNEKISLATIYNTVCAFKNRNYLKEISINSNKSYFDTNVSNHHHFFDEDTNQLIDCDNEDIERINLKKNITGKKINSIEVLIKVASDNQNQK